MPASKEDALKLLDSFNEAVATLRSAVEQSDLPPEDWEEICGGLAVMAVTVCEVGLAISSNISRKLIVRSFGEGAPHKTDPNLDN